MKKPTPPIRRAGTVRRDGQPRPQDDLPRALCHGGARHADRGVDRRGIIAMDARTIAAARDRQHRELWRAGQPTVLPRLPILLRYVQGNYNDSATFAALK